MLVDAHLVRVAGKIPLTVIVLGLVSFLTDAATEMIYPLVPLYVAALGSGVVLGTLLTIAALLTLMLALGVRNSLSALRWTFALSIIVGALAVATIVFFVKETAPKARKYNEKRETFVPPNESRVLNKERTRQCTEACLTCGLEIARNPLVFQEPRQ